MYFQRGFRQKNYRFNIFFICLLLFVFFFLSAEKAVCASPQGFSGRIIRIESHRNLLVVRTDDNRNKEVRITPQTKIYKKIRPLPAPLDASLQDLKAGERVYVLSHNAESPTPTAVSIWENRAFAVRVIGVQAEKPFTGEVRSFRSGEGLLTLHTIDGELTNLRVTGSTQLVFDDNPGHRSDIRPGNKVIALCRWQGFEEDMPQIPVVIELIDSSTYVIRRYREKFGPLISRGRVMEVNLKDRIIKVASAQGQVDSISFKADTRWIPASPRIKTPADFAGYTVYVFGASKMGESMEAGMVMNIMGLNNIYQALVRERQVQGAIANLAFGDVLGINPGWIEVMHKGNRVRIRLVGSTVYLLHGRQGDISQIKRGDRVLIQGVYGDPSIAVVVKSFGKVKD